MAAKLIQLVSNEDALYGLADDGSVFVRTWSTERIPGEFTYDEYSARVPVTRRVYRWEKIESLPDGE